MLCSRNPDNLLAREIIGPLEDFFYGVKLIRLLQRSSESYFLIVVCFMSVSGETFGKILLLFLFV